MARKQQGRQVNPVVEAIRRTGGSREINIGSTTFNVDLEQGRVAVPWFASSEDASQWAELADSASQAIIGLDHRRWQAEAIISRAKLAREVSGSRYRIAGVSDMILTASVDAVSDLMIARMDYRAAAQSMVRVQDLREEAIKASTAAKEAADLHGLAVSCNEDRAETARLSNQAIMTRTRARAAVRAYKASNPTGIRLHAETMKARLQAAEADVQELWTLASEVSIQSAVLEASVLKRTAAIDARLALIETAAKGLASWLREAARFARNRAQKLPSSAKLARGGKAPESVVSTVDVDDLINFLREVA